MIGLLGGVLKGRGNVSWLQVRVVREDFFAIRTGRQKIKDILNPHPHVPNARSASALFGMNRNPV